MIKVRLISVERMNNHPAIEVSYGCFYDKQNTNGWIDKDQFGTIEKCYKNERTLFYHNLYKYRCYAMDKGFTSPRLVEEIVEGNTEENRTEILGVINRR